MRPSAANVYALQMVRQMGADVAGWVKKRAALLWFAGGVLFAVTLGPMLLGAAGALFWTMQVYSLHSEGDDTLAARAIVAGADDEWGVPEFGNPSNQEGAWWRKPTAMDWRECGVELPIIASPFSVRHDYTIMSLRDAILRDEVQFDTLAIYQAAERSLRRAPRLVLGAGAGCVEHSVLAGACAFAVRSWLAQDKAFAGAQDAALQGASKRREEQMCFLLDAAKSFSAKSKINSPPSTEQRK
jgi:hypothetical protein